MRFFCEAILAMNRRRSVAAEAASLMEMGKYEGVGASSAEEAMIGGTDAAREAAEGEGPPAAIRAPGPLDGVLLARHRPLAHRRPGARDRRRLLLRRQGADVGVHDRLPGPQPGPQPVRRRRDPGRVRAGLHRAAGEGRTARGVPSGLHADLPRRPDPRRAHGDLHPRRPDGHEPGRPGLRGRAARPHRRPLAPAVPDPGAARADRDGRRSAQQLRPLRGLRDLPVLLERRDHRGAGRWARRCSRRATRSTPMRSASWSGPWSSC